MRAHAAQRVLSHEALRAGAPERRSIIAICCARLFRYLRFAAVLASRCLHRAWQPARFATARGFAFSRARAETCAHALLAFCAPAYSFFLLRAPATAARFVPRANLCFLLPYSACHGSRTRARHCTFSYARALEKTIRYCALHHMLLFLLWSLLHIIRRTRQWAGGTVWKGRHNQHFLPRAIFVLYTLLRTPLRGNILL